MSPKPWWSVVLSVVVIGTFCGEARGVAYDWSFTVLDNGGRHSSVAVDHNDQPHIVYYGQDGHLHYGMQYITIYGTLWTKQVLDSGDNVGQYCKIVGQTWDVDPQTGPYTNWHVVYYDALSGDLKYAFKSPWSAWGVEVVDDSEDSGKGCDLDVDSAGRAHVAYLRNAERELKYAKRVASTWTRSSIDSTRSLSDPILRVDSQDTVRVLIATLEKQIVSVARDNDVWTLKTMDNLAITQRNLAADLGADDNWIVLHQLDQQTPNPDPNAPPWEQHPDQWVRYVQWDPVTGEETVEWIPAEMAENWSARLDAAEDDEAWEAFTYEMDEAVRRYGQRSPITTQLVQDNVPSAENITIGLVLDSRGHLHATYYNPLTDELIYAYGVPVPEPATMLFFFTGLGALAALRRRRRP